MSLGKNISSSLLTQIPVFVLSVISGIFVTRMLGAEGKGVYSLFQADLQFFVLLLTFSAGIGITYFTANSKISVERIFGMALVTVLTGLILLVLFFIILFETGYQKLILSNGHQSFFYCFYLISGFLVSALNLIFSSVFQGMSRFGIINKVTLFNSSLQFLTFGTMLVLAENYGQVFSVYAVFLVSFCFLMINLALWVYLFRKHIHIKPDFNLIKDSSVKIFYSYIFIIYLGTVINFLNYRLDLWLVNHFLSEKDLGIYSLAGNIIQLFITISVVVSSVMLPYLSQNKSSGEILNNFRTVSRLNFFVLSIGVVIAFLSAEMIIPALYGREFIDSVSPFMIILPGVLLSCATQLFATLIVAKNRNILNIFATSCGLIITLILDLILIPEMGIEGAAWATVIVYTSIFLITFALCILSLKIPFQNYFIPNVSELKLGMRKLKTYIYNR